MFRFHLASDSTTQINYQITKFTISCLICPWPSHSSPNLRLFQFKFGMNDSMSRQGRQFILIDTCVKERQTRILRPSICHIIHIFSPFCPSVEFWIGIVFGSCFATFFTQFYPFIASLCQLLIDMHTCVFRSHVMRLYVGDFSETFDTSRTPNLLSFRCRLKFFYYLYIGSQYMIDPGTKLSRVQTKSYYKICAF